MKWTIGLLVLLGVVAAVCAVLLVNAIRVDSSMQTVKKGEIAVVLAIKDLPAMTVLTADAIESGSVKTKEAPQGHFTNPIQIVGKILSKPIVKGEILTKANIISEGSGAQLAAALPPGMRAISLNMSSQSISGGLLYPGCVVDVLASFKLTGSASRNNSKGEAISTTLLHGIQVLAVAGESVISKSDAENEADKIKSKARSTTRNLTVTLLVDPRQAEALQLAALNGTISLAMRNPLDDEPVDYDATVLNRGKLSKLGALLGSTVDKQKVSDGTETTPTDSFSSWSEPEPKSWEVTVIRGSKVADQEVNIGD
jgi:pilus assembly protein CpaB